MQWLAILSLFAILTCLALGIKVYLSNKKASINKIFLLANIALFIYGLTTILMWTSNDTQTAFIWHKAGTIWPLFVALVLNFALIYTDNSWIKKKQTYLTLYLPAIAFWLIDLFTNEINSPPVLKYWGFNDVASNTFLYYFSTIWTTALPIIAFILCFRFYRLTNDPSKKQQRKIITVGFAIPIALFITTNIITRLLGIDFPNMGFFASLFFSIFAGYAIYRCNLFTIITAVAAESIIATIPDAFILCDPNGKILKVNSQTANFLVYSIKELTSKNIIDLLTPREKCNWTNIVNLLKKEGVITNFELEFVTKTNKTYMTLFSGSLVRNKDGDTLGITCIMKDFTGRLEMQAKLLKSEQLASIGELATQVAHDLRNPLAAIKNANFLLKKNSASCTDKRLKICSWIDNAVADSDRIINSLLDYTADLTLQREYCTPKSLTSNALSKLTIPERIVIRDTTANAPRMLLDTRKIEDVFVRVIQNAIDAMPEKGVLKISSYTMGNQVEISFTDSGIGIPEGIRDKLFSPLVTTKAKGMGMSLAICKRIVDAHEGILSFDSIEGQGTTFSFVFLTPVLDCMNSRVAANK